MAGQFVIPAKAFMRLAPQITKASKAALPQLTKAGKAAQTGTSNAVRQFGQVFSKPFSTQMANVPKGATAQISRKIPLQSKILPNAQTLSEKARKVWDAGNTYGINELVLNTGGTYLGGKLEQKYPKTGPYAESLIQTAIDANNMDYESYHPDAPPSALKPIVSDIVSPLASRLIKELTAKPPQPELSARTNEH